MLLNYTVFAQVTLERQVLGSNGATGIASWGTVDYTVGECIVATVGPSTNNIVLTQGFQQPDEDTIPIGDSIKIIKTNSPCIGANAGTIAVNSTYILSPGTVIVYVYSVLNLDTTDLYIDTLNNIPATPMVYSANVPVGTYYYSFTIGNNPPITGFIVISEEQVPCLYFWSGLTPNGDNHNDKWVIDGIEFYTDNFVSIFNRWGDRVWKHANYNNVDVVWEGTTQAGAALPDATYFYIVEIEGRVYKGWVELTH